MYEYYEDRFGVSDSSAATLTIVTHRGNAVTRTLELVSKHLLADGSFQELPIDIAHHTLESGIYSGQGVKVGQFSFTKTGAGVVDMFLSGADTEQLEPGTYDYYFDHIDAGGRRYTRLKGKLELLPK